jgi:predicted  nucleic acid-binding Zn-ribbon protein
MKIFQGLMKMYQVSEEDLSLGQRIRTLEEKYQNLLEDVVRLENENIELTNSIYECENRLQAQIDNIHPVVYNIQGKE